MSALPQNAAMEDQLGGRWPELERCEALLAQHLDEVFRTLGSAALGLVDLPPLSEATPSPAHLKAAAVLLWAREVEGTGLLRFVEKLAEGVVRGQIVLPIRSSGSRLMRYHRGRGERFTAVERLALYSQLFGGPGATHPNDEFLGQLQKLLEALDELGRAPSTASTTHLLVRARTAADALARSLSARAAGITAFAARDIVAHVREAISLLRDPDLSIALGGGGIWRVLVLHGPSILGEPVEIDAHLTRTSAGLALIGWLAQLSAGALTPAAAAPAIQAAAQWLAVQREA